MTGPALSRLALSRLAFGRLAPSRLAPSRLTSDDLTAGLLLAALACAVAIRVLVAGVDGPRSIAGGMVFGLLVLVVAVAAGGLVGDGGLVRGAAELISPRAVLWGVGTAAVLSAPPLWHRLHAGGAGMPSHGFALWAGVVTLVAVAEEVLLRGALFEAVRRVHGDWVAIAVAAGAFAALHVPLYGWGVIALDVAVGVALGVVRVLAGSVTAPALAHVGADLTGWWLR